MFSMEPLVSLVILAEEVVQLHVCNHSIFRLDIDIQLRVNSAQRELRQLYGIAQYYMLKYHNIYTTIILNLHCTM